MQTLIEKRLLEYVSGNRLHPALVFSGSQQEEKVQAAQKMAKLLFCKERLGLKSCEACSSCKRIEKKIHPDVFWLEEEGEDTIKIEKIRELASFMELTPVESIQKIAIILDSHRMTKGASNAFLKTLEEPLPGRYFWLLTSQLGAHLPTIISRCLLFHFSKDSESASRHPVDYWKESFLKSIQEKDPSYVLGLIKEKDEAMDFIKVMQKEIHAHLLEGVDNSVFKGRPLLENLFLFEQAVEVEGSLRTNASHLLLVDRFIREVYGQA
jgi:DNA polymerase III delta prime subunit